jgi:hypothetical protein
MVQLMSVSFVQLKEKLPVWPLLTKCNNKNTTSKFLFMLLVGMIFSNEDKKNTADFPLH